MMRTVGRVSGFTLIELLLALTVAALLLAVALPSYQSLRQEQMVRAATQAVYTDMMLLKSEAIKRNKPLTFKIFNPGQADWCYRIAIDGSCDSCADSCSSIEGRKGVDAGEFSGVLLASNFAISGAEIAIEINNRRGAFKSLHGAPHNGSICLRSGDSESRVIVALNGRIRTDVITGVSPCI
ncbi:GspH/FimT family pseudopilin [Aeromonas media]|uniref:GspH/FimT family pseudopilin n=1 Tax=Aeromonas media TaxID=651 RepID=UPI003D22C6AB